MMQVEKPIILEVLGCISNVTIRVKILLEKYDKPINM